MKIFTGSLLTLAIFFAIPALAQEGETDRSERGDRGITLTPSQPEDSTALDTAGPGQPIQNVLPALPETLPEHAFTSVEMVFIDRIDLAGATVLPPDEVTALADRYTNRRVSISELHELRYRLTALYVQNGYVSSGVVLPDQRIDNGIVRLGAIEGRLDRISVSGNRTLHDSYIEKRLRREINDPVNTADIQRALQMLESDSRIGQVNAQLVPGAKPGQSTLRVNIVENTNHWVRTAYDNYRSPSVDENRVSLSAGNTNFFGIGDILAIDYGNTDGLDDFDVSYSIPLTAADLRLSAYYRSTDSIIVEEPFDIVDIQSDSESMGLSLSRPFRSGLNRTITATIGFENRHAENWLLGVPFSFTPGEQDGVSEVSVAYITTEALWQAPNRIVGMSVSGRFGLDAMDATINESGPDSEFTAFRAQFQYARILNWRDSQFVLRASAQYSPDPLLALEKFSIGGHRTVRGYRENQLVRDNGVVASMELRFPLFVDEEGNDTLGLQIAPFIDYGVSWDSDDALPTSDSKDVASIGIGLRWQAAEKWAIAANYGYALTDVVTPTESLQDKGFQFRVEYNAVSGR